MQQMTLSRQNLIDPQVPQPRIICLLTLLAGLLAGSISTCAWAEASAQAAADPGPAREISWEDLLPEGWVPPSLAIDHFFDPEPPEPANLADVPVVPELDGQRVKLPGYLVPLAMEEEKLKEFLMVPYFGACIHVPPPPPNQIVFVSLPEAVFVEDPYGPHWVTGVLRTSSSSTELADAAYTLSGELVEVFDWDAWFPEEEEVESD
jgi:hypothetical protein